MLSAFLRRSDVRAFLRRPRVTPVVVFAALGILTTFLRSLVINPGEDPTLPLQSPASVAARAALAAAWFALTLWAVRPGTRGRLETAALWAAAAAVTVLVVWADRPAAALLVTPVVARYWLSLKGTLALFAALFVASIVIYLLIPPLATLGSPEEWLGLLGLVVLTLTQGGFTYAAFEFMLRHEDQQVTLRRAYRELRGLRAVELQHAALQERTHLSRELHDTLGHQLTALRLEAQRVRKLQQRDPLDPRIQAALDNVMARSGEALGGLQQVVSTLKPPDLDGSLGEALRDLTRTWPGEAHLSTDGVRGEWPSAHNLTVYRALQEALTNAHKHAPDCPVTARLTQGDHIELTVSNPRLPGLPPGPPSGRAGLSGLRARAEELGGTLRVRDGADTFELTLTLPLPGDPA